MSLNQVNITRLEKAATDNGFDLERGRDGDWLVFGSSHASPQIWLTALGESLFLVALSRSDIFDALANMGAPFADPIPKGAAAARCASDLPALHRLVRRAFQLARALPDEPLRAFLDKTAKLPRTTEAERLVVQRIGQGVFRDGLLDYWEGHCAITGLRVPELLRASHIKPWAHCESDAERLDVFNGSSLRRTSTRPSMAASSRLPTMARSSSQTPSSKMRAAFSVLTSLSACTGSPTGTVATFRGTRSGCFGAARQVAVGAARLAPNSGPGRSGRHTEPSGRAPRPTRMGSAPWGLRERRD